MNKTQIFPNNTMTLTKIGDGHFELKPTETQNKFGSLYVDHSGQGARLFLENAKMVSHKVADNVVINLRKDDDITVIFTDDKGTKHSVVFEEKNAKIAYALWQVVKDLDSRILKL